MIIIGSQKELVEQAAWSISDELAQVITHNGTAVIAVAGGRNVRGIFKALAKEDLPFDRIHLFIVDERLVPLDDTLSNYNLVLESGFADVFPEENIHPFVFNPKVEDKGAHAYAAQLELLGGRFDVVLLSAGEDGHIAGLYPHHHSVSDEGLFVTMDDSPKPPAARMSSSRSLLEKSGFGVVLFFGEAKRSALTSFLDESVSVEECPAKIALLMSKHAVFTDLEVTDE